MSAETRAVWLARMGAELERSARTLNDSLPFDRRLWRVEIALSRAYAEALTACGVLEPGERQGLLAACEALEADLAAGRTALEGEDVHSAVEAELVRRCGVAGQKLHTGRSRNDQTVTLLRMRVMRLCNETLEGIRGLERVLVGRARACDQRAVAAYTHLQPAQPVLLAHWWLAHVAALERDEERFENARQAADLMALGSGAVAGTPLRYDRAALADRLGFSRLATNSIDAVGDRDFALEYLHAAATLGIHLSRLAEDLVLACSPGFGWFRPAPGYATGSSLLPQKRNPDLFELARAKSGRLLANAQRLATVLKGLPSGYQKDLQEDKEAVFDTADTLEALLGALAPALAALEERPERIAETLTPDLLAAELADALVAEGVPFREAHGLVGRLWAAAEHAGVPTAQLPEAERLSLSPHFTLERLAALDVEVALERRSHPPGGGPESVAAQLAAHEARLGLGPGGPAVETIGEPGGRSAPTAVADFADRAAPTEMGEQVLEDGIVLRRARLADIPGIAAVMADYVVKAVLLPRPVSELFQCVREFHVAVYEGEIVACAALRLLWDDLGEVRSLAVRPDFHGRGLGARLVARLLDDARSLALPRVIALTREVPFFERCGFQVVERETLPRKVWTDCVRCPRRHACDEVAVVLDLVPGASEQAARARPEHGYPLSSGVPSRAELPIVT